MKPRLYTVLLYILRSFVYIKRAVFFLLHIAWQGFGRLHDLYSETIGFRLYKIYFFFFRKLQKYHIRFDKSLVELFSRRAALQGIFLALILLVIFPESKLYTKEITNRIPGRQTLLYQLVGPGDQDFALDDIVIEEAGNDIAQLGQSQSWREGALSVDGPVGASSDIARVPQDIGGITAGGSAITKPTIIPGMTLPTLGSSGEAVGGVRSATVEYTVQPGDVLGVIAEQFGISVNTILWANNLTTRSYIRPGDTLKIPPQSGVFHVVKRGDTVNAIANTYDAKAPDIIAFNKLQENGADIVVGEELFIPGGEKKAPTPVYTAPIPNTIARQVAAPQPSVEAPAGSGYIWPTNVRTITQYFGWRHTGVDIAGPVGSALYAAQSGTVITSQCGWNGGYGCYIIVDHGGGVTTLYGHASQLDVSVGDDVDQGQVIGLMGSTGRSTGPHVHFEVRVNGSKQNPLKYVR